MTDNFDRSTESLLARRALAEKATPGPWYADRNGYRVITQYTPLKDRTFGYGCGNEFICDLNDGEYHEYHDDKEQINTAAHIAANSPDVVMADIDEIQRLRAEVNYWQQEARDLRQIFERMYARLKKEADWLAQYAANGGWHGVRVSREFMREQARKTVEES